VAAARGFFRQLSQPFSADYAEALNNADAPGVLKGRQEGRRGLRFLVGVEASETEVVTRGGKDGGVGGSRGGVAGRTGDFARRVIVKLSSIYFTNLHITSAVVAASQRRVQKRADGGMGATRRVSSATYVRT